MGPAMPAANKPACHPATSWRAARVIVRVPLTKYNVQVVFGCGSAGQSSLSEIPFRLTHLVDASDLPCATGSPNLAAVGSTLAD